jgi:hypothetical protein
MRFHPFLNEYSYSKLLPNPACACLHAPPLLESPAAHKPQKDINARTREYVRPRVVLPNAATME